MDIKVNPKATIRVKSPSTVVPKIIPDSDNKGDFTMKFLDYRRDDSSSHPDDSAWRDVPNQDSLPIGGCVVYIEDPEQKLGLSLGEDIEITQS